MKQATISVKIYDAYIEAYLANVGKVIKKLEKKYQIKFKNETKKSCGFIMGIDELEDGMPFIIVLKKNVDWNTLVHECLHLAYHILARVHVKHKLLNHESLTYLHMHIIRKITKAFKLKIVIKKLKQC